MRLAQGAEAILWKEEIEGEKRKGRSGKGNKEMGLRKERVSKGYRHPEIDREIRKRRTRGEARLLERAKRAGVNVPEVLGTSDFEIEMEFIEGERVKDVIAGMPEAMRKKLGAKIGKSIALLHTNSIIHGDLTTSNMIRKEGSVYFIDFGLGEVSPSIEKMAVDLRLLKEVFTSTHYKYYSVFEAILAAYKWERAEEVVERLKKVETRGRYVKRKI